MQGFQPICHTAIAVSLLHPWASWVHLCSASRQPDSCQRRSHAMALVQGCRGLQGWLASIRMASSCAIGSSPSTRHVEYCKSVPPPIAVELAAKPVVLILRDPRGPLSCPGSHCVATHTCSAAWHASHLRSLHADCSLGAECASSGAPGSSSDVVSTSCAALPAPPQWCRQYTSVTEASQCGVADSDGSRRFMRHLHSASLAEQRNSRSSASSVSTSAEAESAALSECSASRGRAEPAADRAAATRLHSARAWRRDSHCSDRCLFELATHSCQQPSVLVGSCCGCPSETSVSSPRCVMRRILGRPGYAHHCRPCCPQG